MRIKIITAACLLVFLSIFYLAWSARADSSSTMRVYNASGAEQVNSHMVYGSATLAAGSAIVTLTGNAVFTNSSSYKCTVTDSSLNATAVTYSSGSQFTILGVLTDTVSYSCLGN